MALESFNDALDAETVLWAVRGLNASRLGVSAEEVVRFLSKDTTLSAHYDPDGVGVLLDSLAADGMLAYEPTTGEWAAIDANAPSSDGIQEVEPENRGTSPGTVVDDDPFTRAFAGLGSSGDDAKPATSLGEAVAEAFLRLRVDELERERNEIGAERDEWRRRAESAEKDAAGARAVGDELGERVRELEHLLEQERAAGYERSDTTRRAAVALAHAQQELNRLEPPAANGDATSQPTRSRRTLRGNWLT
jgi:hypothetical protein